MIKQRNSTLIFTLDLPYKIVKRKKNCLSSSFFPDFDFSHLILFIFCFLSTISNTPFSVLVTPNSPKILIAKSFLKVLCPICRLKKRKGKIPTAFERQYYFRTSLKTEGLEYGFLVGKITTISCRIDLSDWNHLSNNLIFRPFNRMVVRFVLHKDSITLILAITSNGLLMLLNKAHNRYGTNIMLTISRVTSTAISTITIIS